MLKKSFAVLLICALMAAFLCACAGGSNENTSSALASSEAAYSEIETSSAASSEKDDNKKESSSKKSEDKQSSEKNEESTSSEKTETSSLKNNSSKKENSSKNSSSEKQSGDKVGASEKDDSTSSEKTESANSEKTETNSTQTSSKSSSIVKKVDPAQALSIGSFHFSPHWTKNYGTTEEDRFREFEDVLKAGYFNTVIIPSSYIDNPKLWEICAKYDVSVWMSLYSFYKSEVNGSEADINTFISKNIDPYISKVKANSEWWELFCGFHHEENIWRGQSNADYLTMTKALHQKYGKRNFTVFATGEFTNYEGNQLQIEMDAANMKKVNPKALAYTTDMAFDSYSVDIRDGAPNGNKYSEWQNISSKIVDGKSYYIEITKVMLSLVDHDVNVWFFPCAYTTSLWGGLNGLSRADENYCLSHLNFFNSLLQSQEYQGGLILYTYTQFSNAKELGMQSHLVIENESGEQLLRPNETKWKRFSYRLAELTQQYKNTKAKHATFNK